MAGNSNSGNGIDFRLSEKQLQQAINDFRAEYGDGSKGMVTWPRFCAYLGYSVDQVRECYLRGKGGKNAYNGRADLLERFATECKALTNETCDKKQSLARAETMTDYLKPPEVADGAGQLKILFGVAGDDRWIEAAK